MMARVREVTAASTWSGSMSGCHEDVAEHRQGAGRHGRVRGRGEGQGGTITSSPQPIPRALSATSMLTVPLAITTPWREPW